MVEKYGKNVNRDWPNLPTTASADQASPLATGATGIATNSTTLMDDSASENPITKNISDLITTRHSNLRNNYMPTNSTKANNGSTTVRTRSTDTLTSRKNNRASISSITIRPERHISNNSHQESTSRQDSTVLAPSDTYQEGEERNAVTPPRRRTFISNRLRRLEAFFFGTERPRGGFFKRLEKLEENVLGKHYHKALEGVQSRL
eukprot:CAMPEP_0116153032 /NCGR_PEP_ID=MMETSP0329-20121206/21004_1 /TAXON_ID=697910 /ORGANISM="Pseudo-nitzschia arenysensis, Strain B593" /LENGTH=204 /DNA_ID=CAMNT_0003649865 /DNA_START=1210 /DNA_END=1821 /DNA_ORIENTATION=-